jgi:hypothetical protein
MYRVIGVLLVTLTAISAQASIGNDIPVTNCFALLAPLGAHPVASEPAANEQGLKFSRVQGALR